MVRFLIVRHALSITNFTKKYTGHFDAPLHKEGFIQAKKLSEYLFENFKIDSIYSSDLMRAYSTAKPTADAFNLPINLSKNLREVDIGVWENRSFEEIKSKYPDEYKKAMSGEGRFGGAESYEDIIARVKLEIDKIASENEGKTVLVVMHGGSIRVLRTVWENVQISKINTLSDIPNASLTIVNYEKGKAEFVLTGFDKYLSFSTNDNLV